MKQIFTLYVEKKENFDNEAKELLREFRTLLAIENLEKVRLINKYHISGINPEEFENIKYTVLSEKNTDDIYEENIDLCGSKYFVVEYHEGQYDQRADSAAQCIQVITQKELPIVKSGKIIGLYGDITEENIEAIKSYYINEVDSKESTLASKESLEEQCVEPENVEIINGFLDMRDEELGEFIGHRGLSLNLEDIKLIREYFKSEKRNPTITEIRVLDTYWSDHCRHTTFQRILTEVDFEEGIYTKPIKEAFQVYKEYRHELYREKEKPMTLMDIAVIGMKKLRAEERLPALDISDEINACSIVIDVDVDDKKEKYLLMFKNETHNHPTEIEPFGGASTCLGGAIRDPLSGRSYVFGAMRITGAGDPRTPIENTLKGKLPQRKITKEAARGYSSYGNQIGLATGYVKEIYDQGYVAKRMEVGAVLGAAPCENVVREKPEPGDVVILLGGRTGRDGIGGASGSSKEHTEKSLNTCSAEVQKGNAPTERKIQRLFRNKKATTLIKKCNDFGAGGVSVAIGELADGIEIDLDRVKKKYEGLDGTELAISESQERMAVVVKKEDSGLFIRLCEEENLEATEVATVTEEKSMILKWKGKEIVNLKRDFLDTNGASTYGQIKVNSPEETKVDFNIKAKGNLYDRFKRVFSDINIASQKGLVNMFDSTIGGNTVITPFGGETQNSESEGMVFKIPVLKGDTTTVAMMTHGFEVEISKWSPFHGAIYAVVESVTKLVAMGGDLKNIYLSFQEYFERLGEDKEKWGKPFSALLGGLYAQHKLGVAAIGGKDSMSGTFKDMNVPPTLISFGVTTGHIDKVVCSHFMSTKSKAIIINTPIDEYGIPEFSKLKKNYEIINKLIEEGYVLSSRTITYGGVIEAIGKMCIGNNLGFKINPKLSLDDLDAFSYGSVILEIDNQCNLKGIKCIDLGEVIGETFISRENEKINLDELVKTYKEPLESVFNERYTENLEEVIESLNIKESGYISSPMIKIPKPKVLIPVFPGTNCEYDCEREFFKAGGEVKTLIFNNLTTTHIEESIEALEREIKDSQIIMLPGGFSAGDEPDGSGKFINAIFRNERLRDAIMELIKSRDGLMLGICNGFQALIKLGLVPYGEIADIKENSPTLTYNAIGRHQSTMVNTKIISTKSPWLSMCKAGDVYKVPVSHGEGRFYADDAMIRQLIVKGQIATQYVDNEGKGTYDIEFNPNGSVYAIEGITSEDGRIFGKMAHSERIAPGIIKNVPGNKDMKLFQGGINYYK